MPECPLPRNARGCINMHTVACPAGMRRDDYQLEDFIIHKDLGTGNVSVVYLVEDRATGLLCALKAYRKKRLSALNRRQVCREIAVHAGLQHENVIQLYCAFEDDFCYYLVLEYAARGDLFSELKKRGYSTDELKAIAGENVLRVMRANEQTAARLQRHLEPSEIMITD